MSHRDANCEYFIVMVWVPFCHRHAHKAAMWDRSLPDVHNVAIEKDVSGKAFRPKLLEKSSLSLD